MTENAKQALSSERERIYDSALRLVREYDMHVFPVDHPGATADPSRGKRPACHWPTAATQNERQLKHWFLDSTHNIGVAMKKSGLLGIDLDRRGAQKEAEELFPGIWTPTFTVRSRPEEPWRAHLYFEAPAEALGNGTGALPKGIDVRGVKGDGGYLVGPGSRHYTGAVYESDWADIAMMPVALETALRTIPGVAGPNGAAAGLLSDRRRLAQRRYGGDLFRLIRHVLTVEPDECRHDRLHWAARRAAEDIEAGFYSAEQAYVALVTAAGDIGLDERDAGPYILRAWKSARREMGATA
ncbi:bifunctional DNA primase/polymerase [Streptomyces wedmorensis]|uniref:bifunctional DNA primase/polymerase n=1 Tax=Streptomyces wedmorensis TaxID=43759 RepID=UPI0037B81A89